MLTTLMPDAQLCPEMIKPTSLLLTIIPFLGSILVSLIINRLFVLCLMS
jgi:hypothetical protein